MFMKFNYHKKTFMTVDNSPNGEVSSKTLFNYYQDKNLVWATYSGGQIRFGTLIANVSENGELEMRYQHINLDNEFKIGKCHSTPEILSDGRIRLHETWQWLSGDMSSGTSVIEEIKSN